MDVVQVLQGAAASGLRLERPLGTDEVAAVQARYPVPLPAELVRLMTTTAGAPDLLDLDLTGARHDVEAAELLPAGHPVAADGAGNVWLLDLTPDTTETAPVFFLSHDPPVLVYQAPDLATFVEQALSGALPDDAAHTVFASRPGALSYDKALTGDQALREFAHYLGEAWTIVDLRHRSIGDGVVWGRYGPRTQLARHGWERVFGYAPYVKARRRPRMTFVLPRRGSPLR